LTAECRGMLETREHGMLVVRFYCRLVVWKQQQGETAHELNRDKLVKTVQVAIVMQRMTQGVHTAQHQADNHNTKVSLLRHRTAVHSLWALTTVVFASNRHVGGNASEVLVKSAPVERRNANFDTIPRFAALVCRNGVTAVTACRMAATCRSINPKPHKHSAITKSKQGQDFLHDQRDVPVLQASPCPGGPTVFVCFGL
jgi:hypothetical protein